MNPPPWFRRPRDDKALREQVHEQIATNRDVLHDVADAIFQLRAVAEKLEVALREMAREDGEAPDGC